MKFKYLVVKRALSGRSKFTYFGSDELEKDEIGLVPLIILIILGIMFYSFKHKIWMERI